MTVHVHIFHFRGANKEEFDIATCEEQAKSLATSLVLPVKELNNREIYIFSYFFDTAVAAKLIGKVSVDGWMDDLRIYILFNSISVISGQ